MSSADELRQRNRYLRATLDDAQLGGATDALCERLSKLPAYRSAQRVAAYFAVNGEIGLRPLIELAWSQRKQVFLPSLKQHVLRFAPYFDGQSMRTNKFRLPEPDVADDELQDPESLDLVLAPLVVFDAECNRIGMGGGYYDRSFAFRKNPDIARPVLIGVAHEMQKVDRLLPEDWDVRPDMVVTDEAVYQASGTDL